MNKIILKSKLQKKKNAKNLKLHCIQYIRHSQNPMVILMVLTCNLRLCSPYDGMFIPSIESDG